MTEANAADIASEKEGGNEVTRRSNSFLLLLMLCSQDTMQKIYIFTSSRTHSKVSVSHCALVRISLQRGGEAKESISFVYKENYGAVASISLAQIRPD